MVVLVRRSPLNSVKASEALRQSVGLTLAENEVTVIFLDVAAWLSLPLSPEIIGGGEIRKHIDALNALEAKIKVESESLDRYGIDKKQVTTGIKIASKDEVVSDITSSEVVIPF